MVTPRVIASIFILALFACEQEDKEVFFAPPVDKSNYLKIPDHFPAPIFPEDNQFTDSRWELGKKLFFEKRLSKDGKISCGSCHIPSQAFSDSIAFSKGSDQLSGRRNSSSLTNVAYHPYFMREGGVPTLEMQVIVPIQEHNEFNHSLVQITELLKDDSVYQSMSLNAYQRQIDPYVIVRAIATFERSLISGESPYDHFLKGVGGILSASALRGKELFFSSRTNCSSCHSGNLFTSFQFENNGLDSNYSDKGRMRFSGDSADLALFKVPTLRNIELTAPYMHDGRFNNLAEVIEHYNSGGKRHPNKSPLVKGLQLNEAEKSDLIDFLKSLTDTEFIEDERWKEN